MLLIFLSAFVVGLSGAMMPGSLFTYTIRQVLSNGPRAGFMITLGHILLELVLIIVLILGLDMVLQSQPAQIIIGMGGGVLLGFMGINMIANSVKNKISLQSDPGNHTGFGSLVLSGAVISATNPYFLLWWAIVGLGFMMQSYDAFGVMGVAVYYWGHITADIIWYGLLSLAVGMARKFIQEKPYRIIIAVLGGLLVLFGVKFVYGAIMGLMQFF